MSRNASIEFVFEDLVEGEVVLANLVRSGMGLVHLGVVSYFTNDENKDFDWVNRNEGEVDQVIDKIGAAWRDGYISGIIARMPNSDRGGELLFFPERSVVSFSASINRKLLPTSERFTDLGWYCERLIPAMEPLGLSEVNCSDFG